MKMFTAISTAVITVTFLVSCEKNTKAESHAEGQTMAKVNNLNPKEPTWEILFDGKDLNHFRNFKKETVSSKWVVKDGVLTLTGPGGGDLITKNVYSSFELKLDYKISREGNSGIMYHVTEEQNTPWKTGPEVQIIDNVDGHDAQKSGWLYGMYSADIDTTHPAGEWNTLRIIIRPDKCEHYLNGKKYCEYVIGSQDWNDKVAASKFKAFPQFGKASQGHICIQDHGNVVSFRNVMIRNLSKTTDE